jgi:hypothetical protein
VNRIVLFRCRRIVAPLRRDKAVGNTILFDDSGAWGGAIGA